MKPALKKSEFFMASALAALVVAVAVTEINFVTAMPAQVLCTGENVIFDPAEARLVLNGREMLFSSGEVTGRFPEAVMMHKMHSPTVYVVAPGHGADPASFVLEVADMQNEMLEIPLNCSAADAH